MFIIEKNVPITRAGKVSGFSKSVLDALDQMEFGDSFIIEGDPKNLNGKTTSIRRTLISENKGRQILTRAVPEGLRLWLVTAEIKTEE